MSYTGIRLEFPLSSTVDGTLDSLTVMSLRHLDLQELFLLKEGGRVIERTVLCIQIHSNFSGLQVFICSGLCCISKQF